MPNRRQFLKYAGLATWGAVLGGAAYPFLEAKWCRVTEVAITVPRLPAAFAGTRLALVTDVHHGPFVPLWYVEHVVDLVNSLKPDLICLGGDYVHAGSRYIEPCIDTLGRLKAARGVYAVLGNHDHWESAALTHAALRKNGIADLTNTGVWFAGDAGRLRIGGVGDFWMDKPNLPRALGDMTKSDASVLLCHNPDYVEQIRDRRVGLALSGHTHGGQVVIPFVGAPRVPSRYGHKYLHGLVRTPYTQVYVSRGTGTILPAVRFNCPPEVVLMTLA